MTEQSNTKKPMSLRAKVAAALATAFALVGCASLSTMSRSGPDNMGLTDGQLRAGPDSPNWVSSEVTEDAERFIAPLAFDSTSEAAWEQLKKAIEATGGTIKKESDNYLHAVYVTRLLRFRDDVEARLDKDTGVIHWRSGSRVGQHDAGTNRRRLERLRRAFAQLDGPDNSASK